MGFSRYEYWSGLPCPPAGDLPDLGIEPLSLVSPATADGFFTTSTTYTVKYMKAQQLVEDATRDNAHQTRGLTRDWTRERVCIF